MEIDGGSYGRVGPLVVQLPPLQQRLPGLLGELPSLLPLGKLPPEASQVAAVLFQKLVLQLRILHLLGTARGLVVLASTTTVCR
jgi:hypothetical protein